MKRGFSDLRRRSLGNVFINWGQCGGRGFAGFRVQDPGLFSGSGRRRRKKSEQVSSNYISLSREKRETNFRIKGTEDLWILKDRNMVSTEVWKSKGSVCNKPIKCI